MEFVNFFAWARFPILNKLPKKKIINSDILGKMKMEDVFYSSILNKLSVFALKYILTSVILWNPNINPAWIWRITQKGWFFVLILETFTQSKKITQASLMTFVTNPTWLSVVQDDFFKFANPICSTGMFSGIVFLCWNASMQELHYCFFWSSKCFIILSFGDYYCPCVFDLLFM